MHLIKIDSLVFNLDMLTHAEIHQGNAGIVKATAYWSVAAHDDDKYMSPYCTSLYNDQAVRFVRALELNSLGEVY